MQRLKQMYFKCDMCDIYQCRSDPNSTKGIIRNIRGPGKYWDSLAYDAIRIRTFAGFNYLIIGHHIVECVVKLIRTSLDLQLLSVDLILNVVNSLVELGDVHLSVLKLSLSDLVLVLQGVDLLNELLFPLQSLLSGLLKLLHVLTNSLKFILDSLRVLLSQLSSLHSSLQLSFLHSELPAQLVQLLFVVRGHLDGCSQVLVQLLNGHLVVQAGVLHNLDGLHDIISSLGGDGQLGDSLAESLSRLLILLLHEHDPPGQSRHIALHFLELFLGLLKRLGGLGQFVIGLIESDFELLYFLAIISDIAVSLISSGHSFPSCLLETSDGGVKSVSLSLEGLHLF